MNYGNRVLLLAVIILFISCSKSEKKEVKNDLTGIFSENYEGYVHSSRSVKKLKLKKIGMVKGYLDSTDTFIYCDMSLGVINTADSILYCFSKQTNSFYRFKVEDLLTDLSKPALIKQKMKGQGPNDILYPFSMVYDQGSRKLYISDLLARCIYEYDEDFNEISRIALQFRPAKISLTDNKIFVENYDGGAKSGFSVCKIDISSKKIENILKCDESKDFNLDFKYKTTLSISSIDSNSFFVTNNYSYNIFKINDSSITKVFCAPKLKRFKLPEPKIVDDPKYGRYISGIISYINIYWSHKYKRLFTLSTFGSKKLSRKNNLYSYITIYDILGNSLCEHKLNEFIYQETACLQYDENNSILYFFTGAGISKFFVYDSL